MAQSAYRAWVSCIIGEPALHLRFAQAINPCRFLIQGWGSGGKKRHAMIIMIFFLAWCIRCSLKGQNHANDWIVHQSSIKMCIEDHWSVLSGWHPLTLYNFIKHLQTWEFAMIILTYFNQCEANASVGPGLADAVHGSLGQPRRFLPNFSQRPQLSQLSHWQFHWLYWLTQIEI